VWNECDAIGVAAEVVIRLLRELKAGRRHSVPFRVVVNQVVTWKLKECFAPPVAEVELGEDGVDDDALATFEAEHDLRSLVADFPERERNVVLLRLLDDLSPDEIAERLGTTRNNVDQGWYHGLRRMAERLEAA
jgi:RNA polymerase sigma factor (sigma-70 family)